MRHARTRSWLPPLHAQGQGMLHQVLCQLFLGGVPGHVTPHLRMRPHRQLDGATILPLGGQENHEDEKPVHRGVAFLIRFTTTWTSTDTGPSPGSRRRPPAWCQRAVTNQCELDAPSQNRPRSLGLSVDTLYHAAPSLSLASHIFIYLPSLM